MGLTRIINPVSVNPYAKTDVRKFKQYVPVNPIKKKEVFFPVKEKQTTQIKLDVADVPKKKIDAKIKFEVPN